MGILDNFRNPFGNTLKDLQNSQNELFKDVGKVLDTSHLTKNPFLEQLYGKAENLTNENWTKDVSSVKSVVLLEEGKKIQDLMRLVELTLRRRDKVLNEVIKLEWDKDKKEIWDSIINLRKRWQPERKIPDNLKMFISLVLNTYTQNRFIEEKNLDEQDLSKLANARYNFVKGEVSAFHNNYQNTLDNIKVYLEEIQEFKRFDELYLSNKNLLNKIPYITFYPSEIKALQAQETGDFTITSVAGLEQKDKGIKTGGRNLSFVGIGQIGTDGLIDSVKWLSEKGIKIPLDPDPRTIPELAIKLTIGVLGIYTEKYIYPFLPANKPEGLELKKILFAAYNAGQGTVLKGINNYINATGKKTYTWSDVEPSITKLGIGQPKEYVEGIIKRLIFFMLIFILFFSCQKKENRLIKNEEKKEIINKKTKKKYDFERTLTKNKEIYVDAKISLYEPSLEVLDEPDDIYNSQLITFFKEYADTIKIREHSSKEYTAYLAKYGTILIKRISKKGNFFLLSGEVGDNPQKRTQLSTTINLVVKVPSLKEVSRLSPFKIDIVQDFGGTIIGFISDGINGDKHILCSSQGLPLIPFPVDGFDYSVSVEIFKWKDTTYNERIPLVVDGIPTLHILQEYIK
jgi:hypothetical protein